MAKAFGSARKNSAQAIISLTNAKIMGHALLMMNHLTRDPSVSARYAFKIISTQCKYDSYLMVKS